MVGALGVNQQWLFTSVFALGTFLAALGGALQMPHEPANLSLDLALIGEAFVVVVVGGMGSMFGAFVAAVLIAMVKAFCIGAGSIDLFGTPFPLSKLTLVAEFLVMAVVLVWRPWGLFGKPQGVVRGAAALETPLRPLPAVWQRWGYVALAALLLVPLLQGPAPYVVVLMIDLLIAVLFAASLHFVMGPAGMHSFGHAAYFGLGAYGAALFLKALGAADGGGAAARAAARRARRAAVRLVLRAPVRRLPRDADPGVRADRLVGRLPVGRADRRQQRPGRHLAGGVARAEAGLLPRDAAVHGRRLRAARAHAARAARPRAARRPRFAAARERDRHRRAAPAMARVRRSRARSPAWPARCSRSRRARSRRRRSASASRSTAS